ncbi:UDP-N-acetylglucosamine 2-epimerase [Ureibacillus sinduriensis]|uniref:UDP-N-acetylglucosamine 2-epimerase n=1 Tax=Ureibacillus sinduriensis BLB-1 = JCM 15800 TaxID=1384057 RepID=A0A0A3HV64_9BACL|nr:UDP-N-acetylglucosamine 2-epimerase [Ureibacillus sinduriensis]KGR76491.1 UDP-N-acetylglucosamine 2-epimerase [Ureibacillus sinduriensis BLB-1 = JCM 15800]
MRKICVVTATRAEYGLLNPLMKKINVEADFELQIIVTGTHLAPEFGSTYLKIEEDGFVINDKVESLLSSDTTSGVTKSMGMTTIGFTEVLNRLQPDLIIILGDRFEMLAVAQVALIMQIPIAHIHGGENTYGAYDDSIRHAITKMATWHFTSTETHKKRVIQMGEDPNRVWNVGAIGIENTLKIPLLNQTELYKQLGLNPKYQLLLITYHPETNSKTTRVNEVLNALRKYTDYNLVFTKANADNGGRYINELIQKYVDQNDNAYLFNSLGQVRYLSAVKYAKAVVGNSSSALIEVPYLKTPSVNIGYRQAGRERPSCVLDVDIEENKISEAILNAINYKGEFNRIFGDGNTSNKIIEILKNITSYKVEKRFYDL